MASLEFFARMVRLFFVIVLSIAGFCGLISLTQATAESFAISFLKWMLAPFVISIMIVEIPQICNAYQKTKLHS